MFLSVVTVAEIRRGIERLAQGAKRSRLDRWLRHEIVERFERRLLPIDVATAEA
jgi:predicted nucleic acid-binding protein